MKKYFLFVLFSLFIFACSSSTKDNKNDSDFLDSDNLTENITFENDSEINDSDSVFKELSAFEIVDENNEKIEYTNKTTLKFRLKWNNLTKVKFCDKNDANQCTEFSTSDFQEENGWFVKNIAIDSFMPIDEGKIEISAVGIENEKEVTQPKNASFTYDSNFPVVTKVEISKNRVKPQDSTQITLTFSEKVHNVELFTSFQNIKKSETGKVFVFTLTVPNQDFSFIPSVSATDLAGNRINKESLNKTIVVDAIPPDLGNLQVLKGPFKKDSVVEISFTASEELKELPVFSIATEKSTCTEQDGKYSCSITVTNKIPDGNNEMFVDLTDLVGNKNHKNIGTALFDSTIPTLSTSTINPQLANLSSKLVVQMKFSEPVILKSLKTTDASINFNCTSTNLKTDYTCSLQLTNSAKEGDYSLVASVEDKAKNEANITVGTFKIDNSAPQISDIVFPAILGGDYGSNQFTVSFVVNEDVKDNLFIKVGNSKFTHFTKTKIATGFKLEFKDITLPPTEAEGDKTLFIQVEDLTGNTGSLNAGTIVFDKTKPQLLDKTLKPSKAKTGTEVTLRLLFSEKIKELKFQKLNFICTSDDEKKFICKYTVQDTDTQSSYHISIMAKDLAGNYMSPSFVEVAKLEIDRTAPEISNITVDKTKVTIGNTFKVSFTTNEECETPRIKIGNVYAEACSQTSPTTFYCTHKVLSSETQGTKTIEISIKDIAGNETTDSSKTIEYDFSAPQVVSVTLSRTPAFSHAVISTNHIIYSKTDPFTYDYSNPKDVYAEIHIVSDEVFKTASLTARKGSDSISFSLKNAHPQYKDITFMHKIKDSDLPGDYDFYISWTDSLGNLATTKIPNVVMTIDTTPPTSSDIDLSKVFVSVKPNGSDSQTTDSIFVGNAGAVSSNVVMIKGNFDMSSGYYPSPVDINGDKSFSFTYPGFLDADPVIFLIKKSGLVSSKIFLKNINLTETAKQIVVEKTSNWQKSRKQFTKQLSSDEIDKLLHINDSNFVTKTTEKYSWQKDEDSDPSFPGAISGEILRFNNVENKIMMLKKSDLYLFDLNLHRWKKQSWGLGTTFDDGTKAIFDAKINKLFAFGKIGGTNKVRTFNFNPNIWGDYTGWEWTDYASFYSIPFDTSELAFDQVNEKILVVGNGLYAIYDIVSNSWSTAKTTPFGTRKYFLLTFNSTNNLFYLFGGRNASNNDENSIWTYNPQTDTWAEETISGTKPPAREKFATVDIPQEGFAISGGMTNSDGSKFKDVWKFDFSTKTWDRLTDMPAEKYEFDGVYLPFEDLVITYGGKKSDDSVDDMVNLYDIKNNAWIEVTKDENAPTKLSGHTICANPNNNTVVLYGGHNGNDYPSTTKVWDTNNEEWAKYDTTTHPQRGTGFKMCYNPVDKKIYLYGGIGLDNTYFTELWSWDGTSHSWTQISTASHPVPRKDFAFVCTTSGKILLFGGIGTTGTYYNDFWEFDGSDWTSINDTSTERPNLKHPLSATSLNDKMYLFGKNLSDETEMWVADPSQSAIWTKTTLAQPYPANGILTTIENDKLLLTNLWEFDLNSATWQDISPIFSPHGTISSDYFSGNNINKTAFLYTQNDVHLDPNCYMWKLEKDEDAIPGFIINYDFTKRKIIKNTQIKSIEVKAYVSGIAHSVPGVKMMIWNNEKSWQEKDINDVSTTTFDNSTLLTFTLTDENEIKSILFNKKIKIALILNEKAFDQTSKINLDYVEMNFITKKN